ncbi:MAG: hypothetical protein A2W23_06510 [Planctomycetes bacterium RBG_16_43_13]|nr:MAG: hypothetical protein A2W23_06510 [Planctomycetes bacterium RBG_16_43_13]
MTDKECADHIRAHHNRNTSHWAWPTDGCGYEQHIKFVKYRNKYWQGRSYDKYKQFALDYADKLERGEIDAETDPECDECGGDGIKICSCAICESVRADDIQNRIDRDNEDFGPELAGDK